MVLSGRVIGLSLAVAAIAVVALSELLSGADSESPMAERDAPAETEPAAPEAPEAPPLLLPNLRSVRAGELSVLVTPTGRELRFSAWLANLGPGPLLLRPRPPGPGCPAGQHPATQVVHLDARGDGTYRPGRDRPLRRRFSGCMLAHRGHDHWHFDAMASYVLRDPRTDEELAARRKVSFCLRDNRLVRGVATAVRREYFGDCARHTRQGISPGWIDVYSADLPGQSLPLPPGSGPRVLCVDLFADPRGLVEEVDEADNGTSVGVRVDGQDVRRAPGAGC